MNMKKMIFFALAGVMSLGLAACSGENVKTTSGDSIPPASSQTPVDRRTRRGLSP